MLWGVVQYRLYFSPINPFNQSLQPLWKAIIARTHHPWHDIIELLKFSTPWLIFFPYGLRLAWENRNWGWAKLVLVWIIVCGLAIVAIFTNGYILPLYPALALASGAMLTEVWYLPSCKSYPAIWKIGLAFFGSGYNYS